MLNPIDQGYGQFSRRSGRRKLSGGSYQSCGPLAARSDLPERNIKVIGHQIVLGVRALDLKARASESLIWP